MADNLEPVRALLAEWKADYERPEGRWGIHGHKCVDDDYFQALSYCIDRLEAVLGDGTDKSPCHNSLDGT